QTGLPPNFSQLSSACPSPGHWPSAIRPASRQMASRRWRSIIELPTGRRGRGLQAAPRCAYATASSVRPDTEGAPTMNIHEYQAKQLLANFGIAVPAGHPARTVKEAVEAAKRLPGPVYVVKAQIHAGGRGKGRFKELAPDAKGGVRLAKSVEEVETHARE